MATRSDEMFGGSRNRLAAAVSVEFAAECLIRSNRIQKTFDRTLQGLSKVGSLSRKTLNEQKPVQLKVK